MGNGVDFRKMAVDLREQLTRVQSELAALREELANANQCALTYSDQAVDLQARLTAADKDRDTWEQRACSEATKLHDAEQRNAELVELLRGALGHYSVLTGIILWLSREDHLTSEPMRKSAYAACDHGQEISAALKPTESGESV